jgi:hypothetical protein
MRNDSRLLVLAAALTALLIGRAAWVYGGAAGPAFSHKMHLDRGTACLDCHQDTLTDHGRARVLPQMASCGKCHDIKDHCEKCHVDPKTKRPWTPVNRRDIFLHSEHQPSLANCQTCHVADLDKKPYVAGGHRACGACHEENIKGLQCAKCHYSMADAGLSVWNQFRHTDNFLREHPDYARRGARTCAQCHREAYCLDCHSKKAGLKVELKFPEAVTRNFIHRGDYLTLHALEAKTDSAGCVQCHSLKECAACHRKDGVISSNSKYFFGHPAGFMTKGSANFHGDAARRDIVGCATCHHGRGPGYCVDCHNPSTGVQTHPNGWQSRVRGMNIHDKMCWTCHQHSTGGGQ